MADPFEGLLGRLFPGNDPAALYGGALSDPATQQQMNQRGLLAMAGSFADSAMPQRMPTPLGAVLGHAAAAAGTSGDALMAARLQNAQAQLAMSSVGLQNMLGPAYLASIQAGQKALEGGGGGIPSAPAPGAAVPGIISPGAGPAPTGPINPELVTWEAKNQGINPLVAHVAADIESSYGTNTGNEVSPSHTGVFQRAKADAPGGQNDTFGNQIKLGVSDLVTERDGLRASLGREPTNAEIYLAHQQGVNGATKLINNPGTPAGQLVRPVNISNNAGNPNAPASAFVQHWEQAYNNREAKFSKLTASLPLVQADISAAAPLPSSRGAVGGLLNVPDLTGQMNAPIPGVAPAPAPGTAAAGPPSAGDILMAANRRTSAPGGLPPLPPGLVQMADASGQVPLPSGPPPGPAAPNLVRGGAGLLQPPGAAPPPPAPGPVGAGMPGSAGPPQVAAGPAPGPPQPLVTPPPPAAAVPPVAMPQAPPPAPAAPPMGGPPAGAPPPLNLPPVPPMPGGMGSPVQPTPQQMIAQGIVGISALVGKPAPDYMQKLAGQPLEMQMEAYKAYVGAQANQLTEKYKKEIEVATAGTISQLQRDGSLSGDIKLRTVEQDLHLRNEMLTQHGLVQGTDGNWKIDPAYLDAQARKAAATAQANAQFDMVDVPVRDPISGQLTNQKMTKADAANYLSGRGGGGAGPGIPGLPGAPGAAAPGTPGAPPGVPGSQIFTPGQAAQQEAVGKKNADDFSTVHTEAKAAVLSQAQATNMRQEAKNFYTGPGAEYNQALNKVLLTLNPDDPERANKVASYETFIKDTGFLAREQAAGLGSRVGAQELSMVKDSLASPTTTARGIDRVMAQVQGLADFRLVKQQAMNNYVNQPGRGGYDNSGFEAQFNSNVSPYTLMYMRLSDQDRGELLSKLSQREEGKAQIQRLLSQHKYLADNNLLPR